MTSTAPLQLRDAHRIGYAISRATVETERKGRVTRISGLAVPYDTPTPIGWFVETIRPGCFARSIAAAVNGIPLLAFHNAQSLDALVGRSHAFTERADGLHGEWEVNDTPSAQQAARAASDGGLGYLSIGFQPIRSTETYDRSDVLHVERLEARLLEVSLTPTPAYPTAAVQSVRAAATAVPVDASELVDACVRLTNDNDLAAELYAAAHQAPEGQLHQVAGIVRRLADDGPGYARQWIANAVTTPDQPLDLSTLVGLYRVVSQARPTRDQRAASAAALRREYLGSATRERTPRPRGRRR